MLMPIPYQSELEINPNELNGAALVLARTFFWSAFHFEYVLSHQIPHDEYSCKLCRILSI